jgi:radical SAM superfamily enzyme YgiQ (UPF0313 family)
MRVFLADLGHNKVTVSSDTYPLGIANLATYARSHLDPRAGVEFSLFREPEDLLSALERDMPDLVGFSSYSWNHNLALGFARYIKHRAPGVLTLMGGPNFPLTAGEQESFLRGMPEIDIAVRGPTYEGERAFLLLMQRVLAHGTALEALQEQPIPGSLWIDRRDGGFVRGPDIPRIQNLDEIPSPYREGLLDPFFESGYFPLLQIARGCPFTCQFCNSSVRENSKVYSHSLEDFRADLLYIAERVRPEMPLCLADDNFGMYDLDLEVADVIAEVQDRYHWPRYIRTTTGKNRGDRIITVMRKLKGVLPMTSAVQSMNPKVLENIKRSNIKLETYAEVQEELRRQGMQSYGELILCLPGETKESFMQGVSDLLDTGVKRISAHQLMLLHGAPLSDPETRERFQFRTRFRVVARNIGDYGLGEPAIETEEMVVETPTFSYEDYLECRVFHLLLTTYYYEGNFEEAFKFAEGLGLKPDVLIRHMQRILEQAPEAFREVIAEFVKESDEELFPTREACRAWAAEHLDDLTSGKLGGNLLSKYSMITRFYTTRESLDFLEAAISSAAADSIDAGQRRQLRAVMDYLRCTLLHAPFTESMNAPVSWTTAFDVEAWRTEGYARDLGDFALPAVTVFATAVEPERRAVIESRIATFGEHPTGLGKFTRTMFATDLRRVVVAPAAVPELLIPVGG